MKKIRWGLAAGICAIAVFYLTAGVIVAFVILNAVAAQTNTAATLFDNWWQTLIFVCDLAFIIGLCGSVAMFVLGKVKGKSKNLQGGAE